MYTLFQNRFEDIFNKSNCYKIILIGISIDDFGYNGLAENEVGVWNIVNGHVELKKIKLYFILRSLTAKVQALFI